jgi:hypothetical protein
VALDIRNQVNNLLSDATDAAHRIELLRQSLQDRTRDDSIKPAAYQEIDAAVVEFGRTFTT